MTLMLKRNNDKTLYRTHDKHLILMDERQFFIASIHQDADEHEAVDDIEQERIARLIVRAVNTHAQLLEALKIAYELLDNSDVRHYIGHDLGEMSQLHKALNTARAAIAQAEA